MTAFRKSFKRRFNGDQCDSITETSYLKPEAPFIHATTNVQELLMSNKKSAMDNSYSKLQIQKPGEKIISKSQAEISFILSCKKNKNMKQDDSEDVKLKINAENEYKFGSCAKENNYTLESEIGKSCKSSELDIKKEVDIDYFITDDTYDGECSFEQDFFDLNVKMEGSCKSDDDDDDDYENYKHDVSNSNFIDNMFKQVGPSSNSLVECKVCYKQIKETSKRQHCNTHTGLKPFPCCYCGARFTRKGDAMRHRKTIHRNIKPFQCVICQKNFAERKILIVHLRNHDRGVYYTCATCGYKFGKREYFQSHIQYIHPLTKDQSISTMKDMVRKGKRQLEKLLLEENAEENERTLNLNDEDNIVSEPQYSQDDEVKYEKDILSEDFKVESSPIELTSSSDLKSRGGESYNNNNNNNKHTKINHMKDTQDTDIKIGTLSFTHKILPQNLQEENIYEDEDLVNKAISSTISQSKCVLEKLFNDGSNLTSIYQRTNKIQCSERKENSTTAETSKHKYPEVHITANFGGSMRKFIIHIPDTKIDPLCKNGLDSLLNMVNHVCSGRDDIIGPVEIELHHLS